MMRRRKQWLATALMATGIAGPVLAQSVVLDTGRWREISESPGNIAKADIPSFSSIAVRHDQTQEQLAAERFIRVDAGGARV
jgi:hypothetical protein